MNLQGSTRRVRTAVLGAAVFAALVGGAFLGHRVGRLRHAERPPVSVRERAADLVCDGCNLLLVSIDTLRADRLGAYGYQRPTSPNIDRLASKSIVFRDVLAQAATTAPSHRSILSGLYVFQHRNEVEGIPLLAEFLLERGYRTAAFVDGGQMSARFGMAKGFETYFDTGLEHVEGAFVGGGLADINPEVIAWLKGRTRSRFFALVHTYDVHCPYTPPEPYRSMFVEEGFEPGFEVEGKCGLTYFNKLKLKPRDFEYISALYDGGVRYADAKLAEILEALERLGVADRTVIIVTSDHGEALGERNFVGHNRVYDVHLKVPWILHLPTNRHLEIEGPVQLIDLLPTVLGVLGIAVPDGLSGVDLGAALAEGRLSPRRSRFAEHADTSTVRVDARWTLLLRKGTPQGLYDLHVDRTEEDNLIRQRPELVGTLYQAYRRLQVPGDPTRAIPDDLDEKTIEQLRALGYTP